MRKPLAVFDCVAFVQSLLRQSGPAVECLNRFRVGRFDIAFSRETLAELSEVLSRSSLRADFPLLTDERAEELIRLLRWKGRFFRKVRKRFRLPRDPKDEPYLNLAIAAKADFLVTRDNDLLDLMRWDLETGREFQRRFRHLRIVDPVAFLRAIEREKPAH